MRIENQSFTYNKDPSVDHLQQKNETGADLKSTSLDALRPDYMHSQSGKKDHDLLAHAMEVTRKRLEGTDLNIRLALEAKNRIQIEVFNSETNEIVRKFPPDEILRLADAIEEMNGSIFDGKF
jgi:uncharacterized FlaG/YvyC family protein